MPFKWSLPLDDELLSNPIVTVQPVADLDAAVRNLYGGHDPVYYQGDGSVESLDAFMRSPAFFTQMSQLTNQINAWLEANPIDIRHESGTRNNPTLTLYTFLRNLLSSDYFSSQRPRLYQDGKRYLEIIAVLLAEQDINQHFKQTVMISLLNDDGLLQCADGCFSRLQTAATQLQNNRNSYQQMHQWFGEIFNQIAQDTAASRPFGITQNYQSLLCSLAEVPINSYEIHARNFLLQEIRGRGLPLSQAIAQDEMVTIFRNLPEVVQLKVLNLYQSAIQEKVSAQYLIAEISTRAHAQLQAILQSMQTYAEKMSAIQTTLNVWGRDERFQLAEILSLDDATGYIQLKPAENLRITLTERALQVGWLKTFLRGLTPGRHGQVQLYYRAFPGAIALSWIETANGRQDFLAWATHQADRLAPALMDLKQHLPERMVPLDYFVATAQDLYSIVMALPATQRTLLLDPHLLTPVRIGYILDVYPDPLVWAGIMNAFEIPDRHRLLQILGDKAVKKLFQAGLQKANLQHHTQPFSANPQLFIEEMGMREMTQSLLTTALEAGIRDFSGLAFDAPHNIPGSVYFQGLVFQGTPERPILLWDATFGQIQAMTFRYVDLQRAQFSELPATAPARTNLVFDTVNLQEALFMGRWEATSFTRTDFSQAKFYKLDWQQVTLTQCAISQLTLSHAVQLTPAAFLQLQQLGHRDFTAVTLKGSIDPLMHLREQPFSSAVTFLDVKLSKQAFLFLVEQAGMRHLPGVYLADFDLTACDLSGLNLSGAKLKRIQFSAVQLRGVNFWGADLEGSTFIDVDLQAADLRNTGLTRSDFDMDVNVAGAQIDTRPSYPFSRSIQQLAWQQQQFKKLWRHLKSIAPNALLKPVRQGLYLSVLQKHGLGDKIDGQCAAITQAFSRSLAMGETAAKKFLANLEQATQLYERYTHAQAISAQERQDIEAFTQAILRLMPDSVNSAHSLPPEWREDFGRKSLTELNTYIKSLEGDFALHLLTDDHVVTLQRQGQHYHYFDVNLLWAQSFTKRDQVLDFLAEASQSFHWRNKRLSVEKFDVLSANRDLRLAPILWQQTLQTERQRLLVQDSDLKLFRLGSHEDSMFYFTRCELYDLGLRYHPDGLQGAAQLLDAQMQVDQTKLDTWFEQKQLSLDAISYVNHLVGQLDTKVRSQSRLSQLIQGTQAIPVQGGGQYIQTTLQQLRQAPQIEHSSLWWQTQIQRLAVRLPTQQAVQAQLRRNPKPKLWPQRLTHAGSGVLLAKAGNDILRSASQGDIGSFLKGSGELSFAFLSPALEAGIIKVTPNLISKSRLGLRMTRGSAAILTSPFDLYELTMAAKLAATTQVGSQVWQDAMVSATFAGTSLIASAVLVALGAHPLIGVGVGLGLVVAQAAYQGGQTLNLLSQAGLELSFSETLSILSKALISPDLPESVNYLQARTTQIQALTNQTWDTLQRHPHFVVGIVVGLGELHQDSQGNWVVKPGYALLNLTDSHPTAYVGGSRLTPQLPAGAQLGCRLATEQNSQFQDDFTSVTASHYNCINSLWMIDPSRLVDNENPTIVFQLDLVDEGFIQGHPTYHNLFQLYNSSDKLHVIGGDGPVINEFMLTFSQFSGALIGSLHPQARNILQLVQTDAACVLYHPQETAPGTYWIKAILDERGYCNLTQSLTQYGFEQITPLPAFSAQARTIHKVIGLPDRTDYIQCGKTQPVPLVLGQGGISEEADIISACPEVVISGNTYGVGSEAESRFSIEPSPGSSKLILAKHHHFNQILFSKTALLQQLQEAIYDPKEDNLHLRILLEHHPESAAFNLDIQHYRDAKAVLIDRWGSIIEPIIPQDEVFIDEWGNVIEPVTANRPSANETAVRLNHFNLQAVWSGETFRNFTQRYQQIVQARSGYEVYALLKHPSANRTSVFGTNASNLMTLDDTIEFAYGGGGNDIYILSHNNLLGRTQTVVLDNSADDQAVDLIYLSDAKIDELRVFQMVTDDLCLGRQDGTSPVCLIQLQDYLKAKRYQHILVVDALQHLWIPYHAEDHHYYLIPYYPANPLSASKVWLSYDECIKTPVIALEGMLEHLTVYQRRSDLCIIVSEEMSDHPIKARSSNFCSLRLEGFYDDLSLWQSCALYMPDDGTRLSALELEWMGILESLGDQAPLLQDVEEAQPLPFSQESDIPAVIAQHLTAHGERSFDVKMYVATRYILSRGESLARCLGFASDEALTLWMSEYIAAYPKPLQRLENVSGAVQHSDDWEILSWLVAQAYHLGCTKTEQLRWFDLLPATQIDTINTLAAKNITALADWIKHHKDLPKVQAWISAPAESPLPTLSEYTLWHQLLGLGSSLILGAAAYVAWMARRRRPRIALPLAEAIALLPLTSIQPVQMVRADSAHPMLGVVEQLQVFSPTDCYSAIAPQGEKLVFCQKIHQPFFRFLLFRAKDKFFYWNKTPVQFLDVEQQRFQMTDPKTGHRHTLALQDCPPHDGNKLHCYLPREGYTRTLIGHYTVQNTSSCSLFKKGSSPYGSLLKGCEMQAASFKVYDQEGHYQSLAFEQLSEVPYEILQEKIRESARYHQANSPAWIDLLLLQWGPSYLARTGLLHTAIGDQISHIFCFEHNFWRDRDDQRWLNSLAMRMLHLYYDPSRLCAVSMSGVLNTMVLNRPLQSYYERLKARRLGQLPELRVLVASTYVLSDWFVFGFNPIFCLMYLTEHLPLKAWKAALLGISQFIFYFYENFEHWPLVLGLVLLPMLPNLLEICGVPVTRSLVKIFNTLSRITFYQRLMDTMLGALSPCQERLAQSQHELEEADKRVAYRRS